MARVTYHLYADRPPPMLPTYFPLYLINQIDGICLFCCEAKYIPLASSDRITSIYYLPTTILSNICPLSAAI